MGASPLQANSGRSLRDFRWAVSGPRSNSVNDILMVLSGLCALVCLIVVLVLDFVSSKSYPNLLPLLVIGVPVLVAGQLWTIFLLNARMYPDGPPARPRLFSRQVSLDTVFGGVPRWVLVITIGLALTGWASFLFHSQLLRHASAAPDPAGVLLFFYAFHWGVETSEHFRRKGSGGSDLQRDQHRI